MNIVVNGKPREVDTGATIAELVEAVGLRSRNVVVERNGEPVDRDKFSVVMLIEDDVVEIVRPVQGG